MTAIDRIYIQAPAGGYPLTRRILKKCRGVPVTDIASPGTLPRSAGRTLVLAVNKGRFIRRFQAGGPQAYYLCFQTGCYNRCGYCYLKTYLDRPEVVVVYVNQADLKQELEQLLQTHPGQLTLYSGELTDSLLVDDITEYSKVFHRILKPLSFKRFEFRTKTDNVETFMQNVPQEQISVTWSLNPPAVISRYEKGAASLAGRLLAAKRCAARGFPIGFHLDPVIHIRDWQRHYRHLLAKIFSTVTPSDVGYISIGCLRFKKGLKDKLGEKGWRQFPDFLDEFIRGEDGKYRYFKPVRADIYLYLLDLIRDKMDLEKVFLCMESMSLSRKIMGKTRSLEKT